MDLKVVSAVIVFSSAFVIVVVALRVLWSLLVLPVEELLMFVSFVWSVFVSVLVSGLVGGIVSVVSPPSGTVSSSCSSSGSVLKGAGVAVRVFSLFFFS